MANINDRINGQEFESASPLAHAVRYDRAQVKTEEQKKQARENIGCYCEAGGGGGSGSSSGGSSSGGGVFVVHAAQDDVTNKDRLDKTAEEIFEASKTMPVVVMYQYEDEGSTNVLNSYMGEVLKESNDYIFKFYYYEETENGNDVQAYCEQYRAANDDDYPLKYNQHDEGGGHIS